jgi:hypothetical protein
MTTFLMGNDYEGLACIKITKGAFDPRRQTTASGAVFTTAQNGRTR